MRGQLDFIFQQLSEQVNSTEILKDRQMIVLQVLHLISDKKSKQFTFIFIQLTC